MELISVLTQKTRLSALIDVSADGVLHSHGHKTCSDLRVTCTFQPRGCLEFVSSLGLLFLSDACGYSALWVSSPCLQMVPSISDYWCHLLMTCGFRLFDCVAVNFFFPLLTLHVVVQVHLISLYKQWFRNFVVTYLYMHNPWNSDVGSLLQWWQVCVIGFAYMKLFVCLMPGTWAALIPPSTSSYIIFKSRIHWSLHSK